LYFCLFLSVRRSNFVGNFFPEDDDVLVLNSNIDVEVIGPSNNQHSLTNQHNSQLMEVSNNNSPFVLLLFNFLELKKNFFKC
jgi:hypothetical protein